MFRVSDGLLTINIAFLKQFRRYIERGINDSAAGEYNNDDGLKAEEEKVERGKLGTIAIGR